VAERIHGFLHPEGEEEGAERDPVREASLEDAALVDVNELREEGREEPS
jgi:hypothetical protein